MNYSLRVTGDDNKSVTLNYSSPSLRNAEAALYRAFGFKVETL